LNAVTVDDAAGTITSFGNGWYRCTITGTGTGSTAWPWVYPNQQATYAGDGTSGIYIWGAQFEVGSPPSSYIPTSGSTATRAAETLTVPAANLPWPTPNVIGTELVTNGDFSDGTTGWTAVAGTLKISGGVLTIADNDRIQSDAIFVGAVNQTVIDIAFADMASGVFSGVFFADSAVYRLEITIGEVRAASRITFGISSNKIDIREFSAGTDLDIDNISVREIDPLSVSIQMDGRMTYADTGVADEAYLVYWYKNSAERLQISLSTLTTRTGELTFRQVAGGTSDLVQSSQTAYSSGTLVPFNIASRHGSTFLNGAVDGTALTANTTPTALPDLETTDLNLGYEYMGTIRQFRMWDEDVGDTGIEEASS
jgi:hypothetical protein